MYKDGRLLKDRVVALDDDDTRTHKILRSLTELCHGFDFAVPIWLDTNINEFRHIAKTRFRADSFIEEIDFDYLEIEVIEEDPFI